ncbi:BNR repeat-containing protein [Nocardioides bruguierae]|uniref:BNR repeat-containing protein n=1 Tax=Nocardioides bruguierae TaxID=2945102 RepID=UPI00202275C5|nr:BNR repeat-containing protein [Nocardioides bruguierae]MCL8026304.1 BNR repeat-containing protein [Nocardioides bruguierae]
MATSYALTGDVTTITGGARTDNVFVSVKSNVSSGALIDTAGNTLRLGTARVPLAADGTFTYDLWDTSDGDLNPTNFQYAVEVSYTDPTTMKRKTWTSGWFSHTAAQNLADVIEEQYVDPTWVTQVTTELQTYVDAAADEVTAAQGARTGAETAKSGAEAARDQAVEIAMGSTEATFDGYLDARDLPRSGADLSASSRALILADVQDPTTDLGATLDAAYTQTKGAPVRTIAAPVVLDGSWAFNSNPFQQDSVTIYNGNLYAVMVGRGRNVMIGKRPVSGGEWEVYNLTTETTDNPFGLNSEDGHNVVTMGIDSQGYIHVAGNMHSWPLRYAKSNSPESIADGFAEATMIGTDETNVTYPMFVNAANGDLLFYYRDTPGQHGVLNRLPSGSSTWSRVGNLFERYYVPYLDRINVGADGVIHIFGCWREDGTGNSNNDIFYMRSADHGTTWTDIDGNALTLPIVKATSPTVVDTTDTGSGLINQAGACIDTRGNPHKIAWLFDGNGNTQYNHVYHDGTSWHVDVVSDFNTRIALDVSTIARTISRGALIASPSGHVLLVYRANTNGLRGSLRVKDITPASYGLPDLGDFALLSIDSWYSDPAVSIGDDGTVLILTTTTGPATVDHEDQPTKGLWETQLGVITMIQPEALTSLAGAARTPVLASVGSANLTTAEAVTSYGPTTLENVPPVSVPPRHGDRLLVARLRGSASSSGGDTGTVSLVSQPYHGNGTVLATTSVAPTPGTREGFFTPWAPLDLFFGDWHNGGTIIARAATEAGTLTIEDLTIEVGVGVDADGSSIAGPTGEVPVASYLPYGGTILEWDAASQTDLSDGDPVTEIIDTSGFGYSAAPNLGGGTWAASAINGQPAYVFDGNDCFQSDADPVSVGHTWTVFVVAKKAATSATAQILLSQDTSTSNKRNLQARIEDDSTVGVQGFTGTSGATSATATSGASAALSPFILEAVRAQTSPTAYYLECVMNGVSGGQVATTENTRAVGTYVDMGARSDGASKLYVNGQIAYAAIFKGALSASERASIRADLATRFGITVS